MMRRFAWRYVAPCASYRATARRSAAKQIEQEEAGPFGPIGTFRDRGGPLAANRLMDDVMAGAAGRLGLGIELGGAAITPSAATMAPL